MEDTIIILAYGLSCTILGYAIAAIRHARSRHQFTRKTWAEAAAAFHSLNIQTRP